MFNKEFYPTIKETLDLMNLDLLGKVIYEPHAGKGDIVKYCKSKKGNFYKKNGTPQSPSKMIRIYLSESEELEISQMKNNNADNADYIEHVILR